jgi:phage terminase small subunit
MKQRPLNTRQKKFLDNHLIKGMSIAESVRRAGYSIRSGRSEDYSSLGCRILKTPRVSAEVQKIREKAFSRDALSYAEKRAFLARAVRTSVGELHEGSDLAQEVTISEGKEGTSRKVKAVDKLRAIELDSKLAGDFYADRTPQASNPFLMIVSLGKSASPAQLVDETQSVSHPPTLRETSNVIEAEIIEPDIATDPLP